MHEVRFLPKFFDPLPSSADLLRLPILASSVSSYFLIFSTFDVIFVPLNKLFFQGWLRHREDSRAALIIGGDMV